jgi:hypothetical protein
MSKKRWSDWDHTNLVRILYTLTHIGLITPAEENDMWLNSYFRIKDRKQWKK